MSNYKKYLNFRVAANTVLIIGLIFSTTALISIKESITNKINLLSDNQSWEYAPGVERKDNGLFIKPVSLQISHNDSSLPQANPSVNVFDSPLLVNGDFLVETEISDLEGTASIQLYGQVPVIFDEWRYERKSVRIEVTASKIKTQIWDATAMNSIDERTADTLVDKSALISVTHQKNTVTVSVNNRVVSSMPDHSIFSDNKVWFGFMSSPEAKGWTLNSLHAFGLNDSIVELQSNDLFKNSVNVPKDSLREISTNNKRKIPIGVAVSGFPLFTDEQYSNIARQQFSMMTPENEMKFQFIHPEKNKYTFDYADAMIKVAKANKMQVHGHMLIAHKSNPVWVEKSDKSERMQILTDHVKNVVEHYKGQVAQWDVINEPMSDDDQDYSNKNLGLRQQLWFDAMGEQYIDQAFITAHKADPKAKLFLNEYGIGKDTPRWDGLFALVQRLKARGVPIDGVGFESHVYHAKDSVDPDALRRHIRQLADIGIVSRISENDVLGDNLELQTQQYTGILKVCLEEPSCTSYGVWGISDLYGSTASSDRYPPVFGDSLIWDKEFKPKPVLNSLQSILKKY